MREFGAGEGLIGNCPMERCCFSVRNNGTERRPRYEEIRPSEMSCHKTNEPGVEDCIEIYVLEDFSSNKKDEREKVRYAFWRRENNEKNRTGCINICGRE